MARSPRPRRQVRPGTLRLARIFGFRFDEGRDAYVLRLVGGRFGPVIRSEPHDMAAEQLEWSGAMDELASQRRKTGRFTRDPERRRGAGRDVLKR